MPDVTSPAELTGTGLPQGPLHGSSQGPMVTIGARRSTAAANEMPTAIACLQCQLIGRRRLTCSKADSCAELPISFALGPVLLAAWFVTAVAFVIAVM